jgi:hypothetical protein
LRGLAGRVVRQAYRGVLGAANRLHCE